MAVRMIFVVTKYSYFLVCGLSVMQSSNLNGLVKGIKMNSVFRFQWENWLFQKLQELQTIFVVLDKVYHIVFVCHIIVVIFVFLPSRKLMQSLRSPHQRIQDLIPLYLKLLNNNQLQVEETINKMLSLHTILSIHSPEVTVLKANFPCLEQTQV